MNASEMIFVLLLLAYCSYAAKPKFRSETGCCICCTKSQTGKPFLRSQCCKERFLEGFGVEAQDGDICSACIWCYKKLERHLTYLVTAKTTKMD